MLLTSKLNLELCYASSNLEFFFICLATAAIKSANQKGDEELLVSLFTHSRKQTGADAASPGRAGICFFPFLHISFLFASLFCRRVELAVVWDSEGP